jgi:hypothetical protein
MAMAVQLSKKIRMPLMDCMAVLSVVKYTIILFYSFAFITKLLTALEIILLYFFIADRTKMIGVSAIIALLV